MNLYGACASASYRRLNQVTLPFEYPIPRCDDAINDFGDSNSRLYFISLDNKTGYHQIGVRYADQSKLAFFGPDGKVYFQCDAIRASQRSCFLHLHDAHLSR